VTDVDNPSLVSASVKISTNYQNGQDILSYTQVGAVVGAWSATTGTLSLSGTDTLANYQAAVRAVRYQNTSQVPNTSTRTVTLQVNDGTLASTAVTRLVAIVAVNNPPVVSGLETAVLGYTEDAVAVPITAALVSTDVDSVNLASAIITFSANYVTGEDVLAFTNTAKITGVWNATTGTLTLTGSDTVANYQAALRTVTYKDLSQNPSVVTRTISVVVNDGAASSVAVTRQIKPVAVNDAPTVAAIEPTEFFYTEDALPVAITATAIVADIDSPTLASATIKISAGYVATEDRLAAASTAAITSAWDGVTGTLTLSGVATPADYQTAVRSVTYQDISQNPNLGVRTLTVLVNDGLLPAVAATRQFEVIPVNDVPALSLIEATQVAPLEQVATAVTATLVVSDVDSASLSSASVSISANYQIDEDSLSVTPVGAISGSWDATTGILSLSGVDTVANYQSALRAVKFLDSSDNPSVAVRTITFTINDGLADSVAATRSLTVTPVNDPPNLSDLEAAVQLYQEGTPGVAVTGTVDVGDPDGPSIASATVKISGNYRTAEDVLTFAASGGITGSWDAVAGVMTLSGSGSAAQYQTALRAVTYRDTGVNPDLSVRSITFQVSDGTLLSNAVTRTLTPVRVNQAPVLSAIEAATLLATEKAAPIALTAAVLLTDVDSATCSGAVVRFAVNYQAGQDVLSYATVGAITGNWDAVSGSLTLVGSDSLTNYRTALRSVKYQCVGAVPSAAIRTVTFQVTDGTGTSNLVSRALGVTAINDVPTVTGVETTAQTFTEGGPAVQVTSSAVLADADNALLASATIKISVNFKPAEDVLAFVNTAAITGAWNATTGVLTFTGSDTVANYQAALAAVTYRNTSRAPTVTARTISIQVGDGAAFSAAVTRSLAIVPVNNAPVLSGMETASFLIATGPAKVVTAALTVSDVDSAQMASAVVSLATNFQASQDILAFTNTATITGAWNATTGVLTLTGLDTVANYQKALRAVTYQNTSATPDPAVRSITFQVNDGALASQVVARLAAPSAIGNMAPALTLLETTTLTVSETAAPTPLTATLVVKDTESPQLASATVQISANFQAGLDVLACPGTAAIAAAWDPVGGTLTLSGLDTPANYQAALRTVTYQNLSRAPVIAARTITFQVSDGIVASNALSRALALTAVNDAPTVSGLETTDLQAVEDAAAIPLTGTLLVGDGDSPTLTSATVQITTNYRTGEDVLAFSNTATLTGTWNATTGTMTLAGTDTPANYQAALCAVTYRNASQNPSTAVRLLTFKVKDATLWSVPAVRQLAVTAGDDAPVLAGIETAVRTLGEQAVPASLTSTLAITDPDNVTLTQATVSITANYQNGEDVLAYAGAGAISGTWDAMNGILSLSGADSIANYQIALRAITYQNTSDRPSPLIRTISFTVGDGLVLAVPVSRTLSVTAVNDQPLLTSLETVEALYTEDRSGAGITGHIDVSDPDSPTLASATVKIGANYRSAEDSLSGPTGGGITSAWNASTGVLTLSGAASPEAYQTALRAVSFRNTNQNPDPALIRTITVQVNDGALSSVALNRPLRIVPVNDRPVLNGLEATTLAAKEKALPLAVTASLTVADVDSLQLTGATVQIISNYQNGQDVLAFTNTAAITGTWTVANGTLALSGSDTLANYQAALRSVTYQNTSLNPKALTRTVQFQVNDGVAKSRAVTRAVTVTPVDDASVLANLEATNLTYTEDGAAVALSGLLTVTDVDNINLASASVTVSANYLSAEDLLGMVNTATITSSWNASTGKLTLSGWDTLAHYHQLCAASPTAIPARIPVF